MIPRLLCALIFFAFASLNAGAAPPRMPDCKSEKKTSIDELKKIAADPNVKNQQDFLDRLSKGSLTNYTFVTNSLSLHRGEGAGTVSEKWPRVLRSSVDGQVTMSFVCDPKNPSYGKVETLYVENGEVKSIEFDWSKQAAKTPPGPSRVHENPVSCVSCHGGSNINGKPSLKHIFPEYFFWGDCESNRGITFYGMDDDRMVPTAYRPRFRDSARGEKCSPEKDRKATMKNIADYKKFKTEQNDNPCFGSLPGFKIPEESLKDDRYLLYPYSQDPSPRPKFMGGANNMHQDAYTGILAQRNAELLKSNKRNYDLMKYYLALEGANCLTANEKKEAVDLMRQEFATGLPKSSRLEDQSAYGADAPKNLLLRTFASAQGMQDKDWTLEFQTDGKRNYFTGVRPIDTYVQGQVLLALMKENPAVREAIYQGDIRLYRDYAHANGGRFACVTDPWITITQPGGASPETNGAGALCKTLKSENEKNLKAFAAQKNCDPDPVRHQASRIHQEIGKIADRLDKDSIVRGRRLVEHDGRGKCVNCHSSKADSFLPDTLRFVPKAGAADAASLKILKERGQKGFFDTLDDRLIQSKTMPPEPIGASLTDQDREDIRNYLYNLGMQK